MDDPALVGVHRLQSGGTAGFQNLFRHALSKGTKGLFPFFPVVSGVDGEADILALLTVGDQGNEVLDGIQGLAPFADDGADVAAVNVDQDCAVLGLLKTDLNVL